ncbi:MAG: hypothetical protein CMC13_14745 [Flavobacteriaceae bacterium]|nr:hypothetical protein [Flavobacteriaceae bacterium]|tara:strand:+ start:1223 stop:2755 length:1533 start_codon:yes stop_codon:yes gene_type:complete
MTKRELQDSAKTFIQNDPSKAIELCLEIYEKFPEEFNNYDAVNLLQAARKRHKISITKLPEIARKFKENEIVSGLCGWYIFDIYIKGKSPQQILQYENIIGQYLPLINQKNVSIDNQYPCPFYLIVSNLWDAHSNNLFNANKIFDYCKIVNPDFLSKKSSSYTTEEGRDVEQSSPYETYFQYYTKACDKLNKAEEALNSCNIALSSLSEFHYDNDLWFKMRMARAYIKLDKIDFAEKQYLEIINSKAGSSKYFLCKEFSELLFHQKRYEESWEQSLRSAIVLKDVKFCASLLLHQSRILARLNRINEAKRFAEVIYAGIQEKLWNNTSEYQKLVTYFKLEEGTGKAKTLFKKLYSFYKDELYKDCPSSKGQIIFIHNSGRFGKIKCSDESVINFTKNSFNQEHHRIDKFKNAEISFVSDYDYKAEPIAENIKIINLKKEDEIIGKIFKGKVQNIVDFGIFIDFDSDKRGLSHSSVLESNFKEVYNVNDFVKVKIINQTEKGYSLKILDKL